MLSNGLFLFFCFASRSRHTRFDCDWSSDVCSSDLKSERWPGCSGEVRPLGIRASNRLQISKCQLVVLPSRDRKGAVVAEILARDYFQLTQRQLSIAFERFA